MEESWNLKDILSNYGPEVIAIGSTLFFITLIYSGGIIASGVLLGVLSSLGVLIFGWECKTYCPPVYNFMRNRPFVTDILTTLLFFGVFGMSVNGLIASAVFSIANSAMLQLAHKYDDSPQPQGKSLKDHLGDFLASRVKRRERSAAAPKEDSINAEFRHVGTA